MFKKISRFLMVSAAGVTLACGSAGATFIDFTGGSAAGADGVSSFTYTSVLPGVDVTLSVLQGGSMSYNSVGDAPGPLSYSDGTGIAGLGDGIGIGNDDEIGVAEMLQIAFSVPVKLDAMYFLDLFNEGNVEYVYYSINNSGVYTFGQQGDAVYGRAFQDVDYSNVLSIQLYTSPSNTGADDYSIAGIDISHSAVPEPATMVLLGSGLLGLAGISRRRKSALK